MAQDYEQILLGSGIPVKVIVQQVNHFNLHWHEFSELLYLVKGSINIHVSGETYTMREGQFILINGTEIHGINRTEEGNLMIVLQFDERFFNLIPDLKKLHFRRNLFTQDQTKFPQLFDHITNLLKRIVWEYNKQPKGFRYQLASLLYEILAEFIRLDYFVDKDVKTSHQDYIHERIAQILSYINNHYMEDLSLKAIALNEHISYYYLSRMFKEITSISFREYLTTIRLKKAQEELEKSKESLLNIALRNGFSNSKSFFEAFRKSYGMTPGEYRRQFQHQSEKRIQPTRYATGNENNLMYLSVDSTADLSYIYSLIDTHDEIRSNASIWKEDHCIEADLSIAGTPLNHCWSTLGTVGRAADLLRSEVREHVHRAVKEIGYRYLRFHGIFCDEMMVYNRNVEGKAVYNWIYVDQVLDYMLSMGVKPFLELAFTPSEMRTSTSTVFWYQANISKPDLPSWKDMILHFFRHCIERYGRTEVATWYAEVWNEPDYTNTFWEGTLEDYLELYEVTVKAIKSVLPDIRVGGPVITSVCYTNTNWIRDFALFCRDKCLPMDFVSFHVYGERPLDYSRKDNAYFPPMTTSTNMEREPENAVIDTHMNSLRELGITPREVHVTEWNVSSKQRFPIRDTAFMAPYLINAALSCCEKTNSLAFWTISDLMEEVKAPLEPFHGGLGMISFQGIPKPAFWAFSFLNKLGSTVIARGDGYIITRRDEQYQVLMYNLAFLDQLAQGQLNFTSSYQKNVYSLFEEKPSRYFQLDLHGMNGAYRITRYEVNRKHGSAYDTWLTSGASAHLSPDEINYLAASSVPRLSSNIIEAQNGLLHLDSFIPIHGCQLLLINPVYQNLQA